VQQAPVGEWRGWASPMCGEGAGVGVAADAGVRRPSAKKGKMQGLLQHTHISFLVTGGAYRIHTICKI
jgi:hypothetical protein